jgi:hypothetical protein
MTGSFNSLFMVPLLGWLVGLSLAIVGYLLGLAIREMRRNRRMDQKRQQLGLRPCLRSSWQFLL